LCYTEDENAALIQENLFNHPSVVFLEQNNILLNKLNDSPGSNIEATSDTNWPIELQKSWPYYIMGVSEMLLNMIEQLKKLEAEFDNNDIKSIESHYTELNNKLNSVWRNDGSHAFLHHINALFSYSPIIANPSYVNGVNVIF